MQHPFFPGELLYQEQHAERRALDLIRYPSYKECLKAYSLSTEIMIKPDEKKAFIVQGGTLFEQRKIRECLRSYGQPENLYQLTEREDILASQYATWLLTASTPRYRLITAEADLAWVSQVAILVSRRYILESKYEAFIRQGLKTFADSNVAVAMAILQGYRALQKEVPQLVYHIKDTPERQKELIDQLLEVVEQHNLRQALILSKGGAVNSLRLVMGSMQEKEQGAQDV